MHVILSRETYTVFWALIPCIVGSIFNALLENMDTEIGIIPTNKEFYYFECLCEGQIKKSDGPFQYYVWRPITCIINHSVVYSFSFLQSAGCTEVNGAKSFFCSARSLSPVGSTQINFSALEFQALRCYKIDALNHLKADGQKDGIVFKRLDKEWNFSINDRARNSAVPDSPFLIIALRWKSVYRQQSKMSSTERDKMLKTSWKTWVSDQTFIFCINRNQPLLFLQFTTGIKVYKNGFIFLWATRLKTVLFKHSNQIRRRRNRWFRRTVRGRRLWRPKLNCGWIRLGGSFDYNHGQLKGLLRHNPRDSQNQRLCSNCGGRWNSQSC